ncbi:MAG: hypothetical protein AABX01_05465 [Candidatus Micrarchaeota archaeon]
MTEFSILVRKLGDPLLDPSSSPSNCICLIDREHQKVILSICDAKFPSLEDETRMLWLREFGVVSDALNPSYSFPKTVDEIYASVFPPDQYSPDKTIVIRLEAQCAREEVAWFSRAFLQLLSDEALSQDVQARFSIGWQNHSGERFKAPLRDFLKAPRIISQT